MKILFISRWYPYPPNNGSKLRVYNLIRGLAEAHEITLLSFAEEPVSGRRIEEIQSICAQVLTVLWKAYNPGSAQARFGYFSLVPRSLIDTFSNEMATQIRELLANEGYDCIIASQLDVASYRQYFRHTPAIFEEVEMGVFYDAYFRAQGFKARLRNLLTWTKYRRYLSSLVSSFDACTVVSNRERDLLYQILPNYHNVRVIPNCINFSDYENCDNSLIPRSIIFTGSFKYLVNYHAMVWFIEEVLPLVRANIPDVKLTITGDHANLPLPESPNIRMTGMVDDIRPLVASSELSVAPLLQGGGTRLKILEAMALKTPVIATSKGAEGLEVIDRENILIADTAQEFADAIILLFTNSELRNKLVDNAYKLIQEKYDWHVVIPQFMDLLKRVVH